MASDVRRRWGLAAKLGLCLALGAGATWGLSFRRAPVPALERSAIASPDIDDAARDPRAPIQPIPTRHPSSALDRARERLGARLFFDKRLSANGSLSCAGCHDLAQGGADGRKTAVGVSGRVGPVNTPTIFNVGGNSHQFWDGRASSLEVQVDGPLQNHDELASDWPTAVRRISGDPSYRAGFAAAYPQGQIDRVTISNAIASYERTLTTPDSPFDRFSKGDEAAVGPLEKEGFERFKSYGCISCHQGRNVGGNLFERLGIMADYFADRGIPTTEADYGRYNVTKLEEDRYRFRVPSLRMAARTAPYFHDGRIATLEEAIVAMGKYQIGETVTPADVKSIAAFIRSLAGDVPRGAEP